jgi:drug/metabolite transporter (DMT)-like permease
MPGRITFAHLALLAVALIYGANYSIAKLILDPGYMRPEALVILRISFGLVIFTSLHWFLVREKVDRKDWKRLALCGLFGVAINQMFFLLGLRLTTPIHASLIMTTTPILVLIVAALLAAERFTPRKGFGVALGMAGAAWLILEGANESSGQASFWGDFFIFINAASYGVYLVMVNKLMKRYNPFTVVRWVFTFGFLYILPFSIAPLLDTDWNAFQPMVWKAVAFVLIGTTFLAYLLNTFALGIVNPSIVSIYIYLQPIVAGLVSIMIGQEALNFNKVISALLIFTGVFLVSVRKQKRKAWG